MSTTIVIRTGSGAASPGIPFWIGYTTYLYQTAALDAESDIIIL